MRLFFFIHPHADGELAVHRDMIKGVNHMARGFTP